MATSGDFGTSNKYIVYWIEAIQNSQNIETNTSNVTVRVWVRRTNTGYTTYGRGTVYVNIDGMQYTASLTPNHKITSNSLMIFERTVDIAHNWDGTKTLGISAMIYHEVFSSGSNSWDFGLTTIPRASEPTVSSYTTTMGNSVTIYTNRKSSSFTHTLTYNWGGMTGTIATGVGDSQSWTIPLSFAYEIPNGTVGYGTITCITYNGNTKIGEKSVAFSATVPSNIVPTITDIVHQEYVDNVKNTIGSYVQGLSRLKLVIQSNHVSGAYGSTITNYSITFEGITYNGTVATTHLIRGSGTLSIVGKITDSRGRTASKTVNISVLPYRPPSITNFVVERANSNGTLNQLGTYAKVTREASISSLKVGTTEKNTLTYTIKSKPKSSSIWTTKISSTTLATGITSLTGHNIIGTFDITDSYDIMIEVSDKFNTTLSVVNLSTGHATMSWGKDGVGIGKIWEQGALDVAGNTYIQGELDVTRNAYITGDVYINGVKYENVIYGSNANGRYIRFPDGTQICFHESYTTNLVDTPYGSLFYTGSDTWTFPSEFISPPQFFVQAKTTVGYSWGTLGNYAVSKVTASFSVFCATRVYANAVVSLMAIGRWK